jgi:hypothetical protein
MAKNAVKVQRPPVLRPPFARSLGLGLWRALCLAHPWSTKRTDTRHAPTARALALSDSLAPQPLSLSTVWTCPALVPPHPPCQAGAHRWYVLGLREVAKAVRTRRARAVVLAPNVEEVEAEGGLDSALEGILEG